MITVELAELEIVGRHGVEEEERARDQRFLFDVWLDVADSALSDRIEDAVDYRDVARCIGEVSRSRQFHLLEALAAAVADELRSRFPIERARVRVRKPDVELESPVGYSAVIVER